MIIRRIVSGVYDSHWHHFDLIGNPPLVTSGYYWTNKYLNTNKCKQGFMKIINEKCSGEEKRGLWQESHYGKDQRTRKREKWGRGRDVHANLRGYKSWGPLSFCPIIRSSWPTIKIKQNEPLDAISKKVQPVGGKSNQPSLMNNNKYLWDNQKAYPDFMLRRFAYIASFYKIITL